MTWRNTPQAYGIGIKLLHGLIAIVMITQIIMAIAMEKITGPLVGKLYFIHKSLGLTLLLLAALLIVWRSFNRKPDWPHTMSRWQRYAAHSVHFCLYILILVMPLSGWFMSSAAGYPPSFWGLFTLTAPIAQSKAAAGFFNQVHVVCAWAIGILIVIHVLGALKHAIVDKDDVLRKML